MDWVGSSSETVYVDKRKLPKHKGKDALKLAQPLLGSSHPQLIEDGISTATVPSPASEEALEVCKDEDFTKRENNTKEDERAEHSMCDKDHPKGQENDSTKNEIKIETESQTSYMETEEISSVQEDASIAEQPEVTPVTADQGEKGRTALKASRIEFLWIPD
ncbi:ADP-ribose glycohydrolase MACROD2 [Loxodonta africana]|uniref:ADP-ribose glycohydrolase MACROD2 n=1 Tax=Loxodonta africana TaxID=9785 RepID=UPI0030D52459